MRYKINLVLIWVITSQFLNAQLPEGFTALTDSIPDLLIELRYAGANNFMGRPVAGYNDSIGIGTSALAHHLKKVQAELKLMGLGLKIYDAYRPQTAVNDFIRWSKIPSDTLTKHIYYPTLTKNRLFDLGFIASKSGHSRGSTVDLSLIYLKGKNKGKEVDMGGSWDFFGELSNFSYPAISEKQKANRNLLRELMLANGFKPYDKEWWHFTLNQEPFPQTYFNFPIEFP
jgi:D-alanyl-D-alanine dipeptidase